ncbi:MAG: indolepyruvate oxidoreductase subunit beta family protein [Steroidobacteraceae bacterium]
MTAIDRPIRLTIAALGGQGGGVVSDWLIDVGRREDFVVQSTSVPGVAQRTGATIYYLEFYPRAGVEAHSREPVFALMPQPGDVDIVVASELVEAGRMILRGLVTADRTTLVTSTHRDYTISEKSGMTDSRADESVLLASARASARRLVAFDMAAIAERHGAVISAAILGGIAGSCALPFAAGSYHAAIRHAGIAVDSSLAAFDAAVTAAQAAASVPAVAESPASRNADPVLRATHPRVQLLLDRVRGEFPAPLAAVLIAGLRRLIDYQDVDYAAFYLDRLAPFCNLDSPAQGYRMSDALARGLALWMSIEDTIRVADLKTRGERVGRIRDEVRAGRAELVQVTEFLKPRAEEICGTLPVRVGRFVERSPRVRRALGRIAGERQISTSTLTGFLLLRAVAGLARWRRRTLRYAEEQARIDAWLADIGAVQAQNYDLAVEIAECQQLMKGYGDTHARGLRSFERVIAAARPTVGSADAALNLRRWREAALQDDEGVALDRELAAASTSVSTERAS